MPATTEHEFRQALLDLYRPGLNLESFPQRATRAVRAVVPCDGCAYSELDTAANSLTINFDFDSPKVALAVQGFALHMMRHEFTNFDPNVAGGGPFMRSDYISHRQLRDSGVYRDGFQVVDINDHAAIPVGSPDGKIIFMGMERLGAGVFKGNESAIMRDLQPFLNSARSLAVANSVLVPAAAKPEMLCQYGLTPREADVFYWMVQGKSNSEIAAILSLSTLTVRDHASQVFRKIGVENRYSAILKGLEWLRAQVARDANAMTGATVSIKPAGLRPESGRRQSI